MQSPLVVFLGRKLAQLQSSPNCSDLKGFLENWILLKQNSETSSTEFTQWEHDLTSVRHSAHLVLKGIFSILTITLLA